ncbi:type II secretion system protein M [Caldicellulosiruptor morganii]|uniref:Type II secretion system protein M n=1 Tax=Caldicellulosiruptor morganii TaxID=1387555 RepID=A0ABY7BKS7_9FIRM|nr:type II secretion system protein M [Caldicellulosiruptor morganii]WAM33194.1 type II secretion system protein M [Caldicellulosiruptor morganii]
MRLSNREKWLLSLLAVLLLGFVFYYFIYTNFSEKIAAKKQEYELLSNELDRLNMVIAQYNSKKKEIEKARVEYNKLKDVIPPNQDEKFCVMDLQYLLQRIKVDTKSYIFDPRQKIDLESAKKEELGEEYYPYFYLTRQTWEEVTYDKIKQLLDEQQKFKPLFTVEAFSINKTSGKLTANVRIKFYGFTDPQSLPRSWFPFSKGIKSGKSNLFN